MTDVGRRRFVQGAIGATAWLAAPGRLIAWPAGAQPGAGLPDRYPPIIPGLPHVLHGGDWNPDQWRDEPGVLEQDFALMEKAGCNNFSVGIFAWAALEPAEGRFELGWLDDVLASSPASTTGVSPRRATGCRGTPTRSCAAGATWRGSR